MPEINLQHAHTLMPEQARHAVQHMADTLQSRFGFACRWQEDRLFFKRTGVDGVATLVPGELQLRAQLDFPVSLMKAQIEAEIRRVLQEKF